MIESDEQRQVYDLLTRYLPNVLSQVVNVYAYHKPERTCVVKNESLFTLTDHRWVEIYYHEVSDTLCCIPKRAEPDLYVYVVAAIIKSLHNSSDIKFVTCIHQLARLMPKLVLPTDDRFCRSSNGRLVCSCIRQRTSTVISVYLISDTGPPILIQKNSNFNGVRALACDWDDQIHCGILAVLVVDGLWWASLNRPLGSTARLWNYCPYKSGEKLIGVGIHFHTQRLFTMYYPSADQMVSLTSTPLIHNASSLPHRDSFYKFLRCGIPNE